MVYPYRVKFNGVYYAAGTDVPVDVKPEPKKEETVVEEKTVKKAETPKKKK